MLKKLFSHTAIYGLAPQIPKIAGILTLPIITAHLTKIDFGVFGLITSIVASISVLSTLGLDTILANSYYKSPMQYKWAWRQIYGFLILWNIPYAVLLGGIIYYFIPVEAKVNTWSIIILNTLPVVFLGPTSIIGNLYYQLKQKPVQIVTRNIIGSSITIFLNIYFIAYKDMGYMGWFISAFVAQIITQVSFWVPLNLKIKLTPIFNFKWRYVKNQLKISLPIVPHYYGGYLLNTSDRLVMKLVNVSTGDIGLYNAANTTSNFMLMLGRASGQAVSPMLMKAYKAKDELLARRLIFTLQAVMLLCTFVCSVWLKEIFYLLIRNAALREVYPIGIILVMAYSYRPMYLGANNRLFFQEKTKVLLKVTFIAGIVNLGLNLIFTPIWGYQVAAYTTFVGLMYMGYRGFFLKEFKESTDINYYPMQWLVLTCILTVLAYFMVELSMIYKVIISLIAAASALVYLRKINVNDAQ